MSGSTATPSPPGRTPQPTWTPSPQGSTARRDPRPGTHHCSQLLVISWPGVYRCPCSLQPHWLTGTQPPPATSSYTAPAAGHEPLSRPDPAVPRATGAPASRPQSPLWGRCGPTLCLRDLPPDSGSRARLEKDCPGVRSRKLTLSVCACARVRTCARMCVCAHMCACVWGGSQRLCSFSRLSPIPPPHSPPASSPSGQKQPSMRCSSHRLLTSRCEQVSMQGEPLSR